LHGQHRKECRHQRHPHSPSPPHDAPALH
jgi:hypothetical protein